MGAAGEGIEVGFNDIRVVSCVSSSSLLFREMGFNQQALYCYRKVYSLDPTNVNVLWDRASLAKEIGDLKTVRVCYDLQLIALI